MRPGPPDEVLAGSPMYMCRVSSLLGGRLLAGDIPVVSGRVTGKVDSDIREELSFTVPRFAPLTQGGDVYDWRPGSMADHPLARFGQQVDVTVVIGSSWSAESWETRVGRFVISDWDDDDAGTVTVKGKGLLRIAQEDTLASPISPVGSFMSEVRRLTPNGVGVSFDAALVDRPCPQSMAWSDTPLKALQEIADAWPALLRTDSWGQVRFRAPLPSVPEPVLTFRDGVGGTLVGAPRKDSREDAYNVVIASSSNTDTADLQGVAMVTAGPMSVNGPYGRVVKKWSSPLISTVGEAQAAAATMLANSTRPAQFVPVRIAPDPRPELDDPVVVLRGDDAPLWGWVTGYDMPLTTVDGDGRIDIGVAA